MSQVSDYWKCSSKDLFEQYELKCYDELLEYSKANMDKIIDLWNNGEPEDHIILRKVTKYAKSILEYFSAAFSNQPELNVMFELGQLLGVIDSIDKMSFKLFLEKEAEWSYAQELKKVKHLDEIVRALKTNGAMNQTELCDYLNLSESSVSQIIKKSEPMKLMIFSKIGKYKYFRLTDYGRRVARKIESDAAATMSMEKMLSDIARKLQFEEELDIKAFEEYIRRYSGKQENTIRVRRGTELLIDCKENDGRREKIDITVEGFLYNINDEDKYHIFAKKETYLKNPAIGNNIIREVV